MKDEERTGHAVLLHEVLALQDLAEFELCQQQFPEFLIFDEICEGEVALETFEDECFVADGLFLQYFNEIFIDLVVVGGTQSSYLLLFAFCLDGNKYTSSTGDSPFWFSLRSISSLSNLLSFRSFTSISIQNIFCYNSSKTENILIAPKNVFPAFLNLMGAGREGSMFFAEDHRIKALLFFKNEQKDKLFFSFSKFYIRRKMIKRWSEF